MEQQLYFITGIVGSILLLLASIMGYYIFKFKRSFEAEQASRIQYEKKSGQLQHELTTTQVELEEQKNKVNRLEENLEAEQASRIQYETESERLQRELNTTQTELGEKENKVNHLEEHLEAERASRITESEQLQCELNTTQVELEEQKNKVNRLEENLEAEQASRIQFKTESERLQRELNTTQTELGEKENEVNRLEENLQAERESRIQYETESERLQRELNTTQAELDENKSKVNRLEENLQAERIESEKLQHELTATREALDEQKNTINRLEKEIKEKSDIQEVEENSTDSDEPQSQENTGVEPDSQIDSARARTTETKNKTNEAGRTKAPQNRGGQRGNESNIPEGSTDRQAEYNPRPELVCRKNGWQWEILLTVPEEQFPVEVRQNGVPLSSTNGEYRLDDFSENLTVMYGDSEETVKVYNGKSPLIFKLRKKWKGDGQKIGGLSRGYFIVFALNEWQRRGAKEACSDGRFSAHYFYSDDSTTTDGFEGHELPSNQEGFSLRGSHIYDNSEKGLLFVEDPPDLEPAESVLWARIGEEGGGNWKGENFKPAEKTVKEVLNGQQGWFYIRVYDNDVKLIDSNDFRYSQTLKEIRVNGTMYSEEMLLVPSADGYMETIIQFIDTKGDNIFPEQRGNNSHTSIRNDGEVIVASHPAGDLTEWKVDSVDTVIALPRIWWCITKTDNSSDEWRDTPIDMSREEFRDNTDAVVQISLPSNIEKIQVGFSFDLHRSYPTDDENQHKRRIALPIRDFVDYEEIEKPLSKDTHLNIQCNGKVLPIICVPAEEPLLKETRVNGTIYPEEMLLVPSTDGYTEPISIRFIDAEGNNIRPQKKGNNSRASICDDGAVVVAPPEGDLTKGPDSDLTEWKVDSVDTVVTLPRIWWRITKTDNFSDGWCDKLIVMSREKFRRNMNAVVQISLPSSVYKIQAEFGSDFQRSYSYKITTNNKNKRIFELPIRDLDYKEIERPSSKDTYLNIQCNGKVLSIIRVPAEGEICPECDSNLITKLYSEKDKLRWYQCQRCKWESRKYPK